MKKVCSILLKQISHRDIIPLRSCHPWRSFMKTGSKTGDVNIVIIWQQFVSTSLELLQFKDPSCAIQPTVPCANANVLSTNDASFITECQASN